MVGHAARGEARGGEGGGKARGKGAGEAEQPKLPENCWCDVAEAIAQRHEELSQIRAANVVKRKQRAVRKKREKQKALEMEKQAVIEKELAAERKKIGRAAKEERTANKAARQLVWEMVAPAKAVPRQAGRRAKPRSRSLLRTSSAPQTIRRPRRPLPQRSRRCDLLARLALAPLQSSGVC